MDDLVKLKRDVEYSADLFGVELHFLTTWGLFCPRNIDDGSYLLLKVLKIKSDGICLDMGCGYGPLGLWMAKKAPQGEVHMVDKDFVAVDYANKNIKVNKLTNAKAYLSNGFSHVPDLKFDVIVSNIPAKVGNELLKIMIIEAKNHLKPEGRFVVVTINGLRGFMKKILRKYSKIIKN